MLVFRILACMSLVTYRRLNYTPMQPLHDTSIRDSTCRHALNCRQLVLTFLVTRLSVRNALEQPSRSHIGLGRQRGKHRVSATLFTQSYSGVFMVIFYTLKTNISHISTSILKLYINCDTFYICMV